MLSFENDIKRKFRPQDITCMNGRHIPIADYTYMSAAAGDDVYMDYANARHVLARLSGDETPRMPLGGPFWSPADLKMFSDWIDGGVQP